METSVIKQIAKLLAERKKHRRWMIVFACMAVVVGFGTVAALRMMGQAMTQKVKVLDCRLEVHEHVPECYDDEKNLICGYADYVVHQHNDDCYTEQGGLVCRLPEIEMHQHTDECYTEEEILVCGQEESEGHKHTEECYTRQQAELLCQMPEHVHEEEGCFDENGALLCGQEEHQHREECYRWDEVLSCQTEEGAGAHVHEEECYEKQKVLSCGKLELHVHTDDCYEKIDKDAEDSEENRRLICETPQLEEHIHSEEFGCFQVVEIAKSEDTEAAETGDPDTENTEEEQADSEQDKGAGGKNTEPGSEDIKNTEQGGEDGKNTEPESEDGKNAEPGSEDGKNTERGAGGTENGTPDETGLEEPEKAEITKTCEREGYIVTAVYGQEANIPEEAEFIAEQITPESDSAYYAEREAAFKESMGDEDATMNGLFKIGFYVNGEEVEPESGVSVTIQLLDENGLPEGMPITVVHFADEGTEVLDGGSAESGSTTFEMSSFSDVAIGYSSRDKAPVYVSKSCEYQSDALRIAFEAVYSEEANIPEEAELAVDQIIPASNSEYYTKRETAFEGAVQDTGIKMQELLKLGFYVNGEEVKPEGKVSVTVRLLEQKGLSDEIPVTAVYFAEGGTEAIELGDAENKGAAIEAEGSPEIAIGYQAEERKPVYVSESYQYESDAFNITFHIEGKATPLKTEKKAEKEPEKKEDDVDGQETGGAAGNEKAPGEEKKTEDKEAAEIGGSETVVPAQGGNADEKMEFTVKPLEKGSEEYEAFAAYSEPQDGSELLQLQAFSYELRYDGTPMDLSDCEVTAEVAPSETLAKHVKVSVHEAVSYLRGGEEAAAGLSDDGMGQDDKTEIVFSMIDMLAGAQMSQSNEVVLSENTEDDTVTASVEGENIAIKTETRANPSYTVQYYANLNRVDKDSGGALELIDTSGGVLPQNGVTPAIKHLSVNADGTIKTNEELTEVYKAKPFEYFLAPSINHINELVDNGGYELKELWVLKHEHKEDCYITDSDGKKELICDPAESDEAKGAAPGNWDVYTYSENLHFTNSRKAEGLATPANPNGYIYIDQKTVIRLVYDTKSDTYNNSAAFYDYDISNGVYRESDSAKIIDTKAAGINSTENCSDTPKYAFGNNNAGTNYGANLWNGNELNKSNKTGNGHMGCTFGLVSGIEEDGNVAFNVSAPKVFGTTPQKGKTQYDDYSLDFQCDGDTYTLSAVRGTGTTNLEKFGHPGTHANIWTNNFWPMDSALSWGAEGHDMKSGNSAEKENLRYEPGSSKWLSLPTSDDEQDHNSYFGMFYELEFDLDEAYCGPLEYLFFGDDDMWVFLDGQLVCDIGGVHSSVGEYVNLWDYLKNEDGTSKSGKHTLKFYYTERGASGSTCWMQFTLPSVTNKQPASTSGRIENSLKVSKAVENADTDQAYDFTIHFKNENGGNLQDDYSYTKYDKDGNVIGYDVIVHDGDRFSLKDGEYIMISYLPVGTTYTIEEVSKSDEYHVITKVDGEENESGTVTEGETSDTQITVEYVNEYYVYELPETGGLGLPLYTIAGAVFLLFGAGFMYRKKFREGGL